MYLPSEIKINILVSDPFLKIMALPLIWLGFTFSDEAKSMER